MTQPVDDVDRLPPTQYLILEVLTARYRVGENAWTFPTRLRHALDALASAGLIGWKHAPTAGNALAWFTDAGRAASISETYTPPPNGSRIRVVAVLDTRRGKVVGLTCDNAEAQQWVRDVVTVHDGDPLAATMTVDLVTLPRGES